MKKIPRPSKLKHRNSHKGSHAWALLFRLMAGVLLVASLSSLITVKALANMANPVKAGSAVGEPSGDLKSLHIERETLELDLRPLAQGSAAIIEATYRVRNEGETRTLDLIFVANAMTAEGGGVWLDDQKVQSVSADASGLPESWQPPQTTPSIDMGEPLSYVARREGVMRFTLSLTRGPHTIRVRYGAQATAHSTSRSPNVYWQLGYVLAPARQWASFGGLDAKVLLPEGWSAVSSPAMKREGDSLVGTWNELPADAIGLTVQAPTKSMAVYTILKALILLIGVGVCIALGWMLGGWLGRRQRTSAWALPLSLAAALAWGLAFFLSYVAMLDAVRKQAGSQSAWTYGYGDTFMAMLYFMLMIPLGLTVTQLAAFISARRAGKAVLQSLVKESV